MKRDDKLQVIESLSEKFSQSDYIYFTDFISLTVAQMNQFRRICFNNNVEIKVVKNTLIQKALEKSADKKGFEPLYEALKGSTAIMFAESANLPAKLLSDFRKENEKPLLKAAYIDSAVYFGDDQLDTLKSLKSKQELIGDIILILQTPAKSVIGTLNSGGQTLAGLVKALEERAS
ncbi:MAG TPA: 50S ribosomal protein L10 [Saprospiraceae bacterium]|nr:50S ribosomal protein L10 [Saprospirales bacterium]HRQ30165.1 50S ribosomal protein L10 [Saprospiraceae bacterium]